MSDQGSPFVEPTLLRNLPGNATLSCEEVFGPVAVIETFEGIPDGDIEDTARVFTEHRGS